MIIPAPGGSLITVNHWPHTGDRVGVLEVVCPVQLCCSGIQNDGRLREKTGALWLSMGSVECTLVKSDQLSVLKRKDSGSVITRF